VRGAWGPRGPWAHWASRSCCCSGAAPARAATGPDASGYQASQDPLDGILHRLDRTFHIDETSGITLDIRYPLNPSETVRLSIVSQLLAYNELYKVRRTAVYRQDVVARADYLVDNFDSVLSNSAFDGMLGYSLLGAYEITHDERYFDKAATIVASNMQLYGFNITLNWGLMAAMGFAKYVALTGDSAVAQKTHDVIASLLYYQHRDGSFAHYCPSSTDIHYTGWMSMELITIAKCLDDPNIAPILAARPSSCSAASTASALRTTPMRARPASTARRATTASPPVARRTTTRVAGSTSWAIPPCCSTSRSSRATGT
jgi:hypothetical protein